MPETPTNSDPIVIRQRDRRPLPVWLLGLFALVILGFALGIALVTSGLLGGDIELLPGPTAFTLTPQFDNALTE